MTDTFEIEYGDELGSEFESDSEGRTSKSKKRDLYKDAPPRKTGGVAKRREAEEEYNKEERRLQRPYYINMDAYARHKKLVNDYMQYYGGKQADFVRDTSRDRTDSDVLRENHKFLWEDEDDLGTWEKRLAKKYYDKLFKEYCITDLSRYKENKIAMRWRIEKEVVDGKGQFICGNKKCSTMEVLRSWEVNFAYNEGDEKKNALVKLRLCPECSYKLNYHKKRREVLPRKKRKSERDENESESSESEPKSRKTEERLKDDKCKATTSTADQSKSKSVAAGQSEDSIWSGPIRMEEDKSRDDEFDEYLADMLL